ncbi:MAG: YlcI/YnfO family protein [Actinomycetota bacterium]
MTKQIAIRLPDELVDFIDGLVASGAEASRAAIVTRALKRERRRLSVQRDIEILRDSGGEPYPDLVGLTEWASRQPMDID